MNKNKFFPLALLVAMFTLLSGVNAKALNRIASSLDSNFLPLQVRIFDPTIGNFPLPKSPVQIPEVYIEGNALTFDDSCDNCTLRIVNGDDEVEYTTIITSDNLVLPSTLEGEYEIQIIRNNWCFYCDIEL